MQKYQLFSFAVLLLCTSVEACELTKGYKEARNNINKTLNSGYRECRTSVLTAGYWYKYAQCYENGDGEGVAGGCAHVIGRSGKYENLEINTEHCEKLKHGKEKILEALENYVEKNGIKKCEM